MDIITRIKHKSNDPAQPAKDLKPDRPGKTKSIEVDVDHQKPGPGEPIEDPASKNKVKTDTSSRKFNIFKSIIYKLRRKERSVISQEQDIPQNIDKCKGCSVCRDSIVYFFDSTTTSVSADNQN